MSEPITTTTVDENKAERARLKQLIATSTARVKSLDLEIALADVPEPLAATVHARMAAGLSQELAVEAVLRQHHNNQRA